MNVNDTFNIGSRVKVDAKFKDDDSGDLTDPDTVTFSVRAPGVSEADAVDYVYGTDIEVTRREQGVYRLTIPATAAGTWWVRCQSTGAGADSEEDTFLVRRSHF